MQVILSARAAWAVVNDADVEENVQTVSMMVRKSRVEIMIYYGWCGSDGANNICRGGTGGREP